MNIDSLYRSSNEATDPAVIDDWLRSPPPWRRRKEVADSALAPDAPPLKDDALARALTYVCSGDDEVLRVNVALLLRRPLLVSGRPGIGKTTLAYRVAWQLGLGAPLRWDIDSRTTLEQGLYHYDAVGHLHAGKDARDDDIGRYISLGPLGTALLPTRKPRVLLVDELDKASFDLPHDLLHVFEEGAFVIPELRRSEREVDEVYCADHQRAKIAKGRVETNHHPVVIITSNDERPFPEPFLRRCVQLKIDPGADKQWLTKVVEQHFDKDLARLAAVKERIDGALREYKDDATDVLLQALFLETFDGAARDKLAAILRRARQE